MQASIIRVASLALLALSLLAINVSTAGKDEYMPLIFFYVGDTGLSNVTVSQRIVLEPLESINCDNVLIVLYGLNSSKPAILAIYVRGNITSLSVVDKCLLQAQNELRAYFGAEGLKSVYRRLTAQAMLLLKFKMEAAKEQPVVASEAQSSATPLVVTVLSATTVTPTMPTKTLATATPGETVEVGVCSAEPVKSTSLHEAECITTTSSLESKSAESISGMKGTGSDLVAVRATSLTSSPQAISRPGEYERLVIVLLPSLAMAGLVTLIWSRKIR